MKTSHEESRSAPIRSLSERRLPDRMTLAGCAVDLKAHSVIREDEEHRLTPKAAGVLRYLLERPGKAATREELLETVWRDAFPTDDVLSHAVTELRRVFGDSARNSELIETIPKVGYRLLISPEFGAPTDAEAADAAHATHRGRFLGAIIASTLAGAILGAAVMRAHLDGRAPEVTTAPTARPLSRAVPVTAETGNERMPALTADGRQVVYAAQVDSDAGYDLYVKAIGSDSALKITDTPGLSEMTPVWSPDATQVAFFRYEDDRCGLFVKPLLGGFERRLSDCPTDAITYIDWSPDGATIALTGRIDQERTVAGILLLDVASGALSALDYRQSASDHDVHPKFSPDGQSIAFRRGAFPRSELFLVGRQGGAVRQLTDFGSQIFGFDWLPDGRRLWFCSDQAGRPGLWELDLASDTTQLLELGCPHMLAIARNRNVMAFEHIEQDPNIVETVTAGGGQHVNLPIFTSTQNEGYPAYAPDGRRIVYVSDRTGQDQLWIGNLVTEESFQLSRHQSLKLIRPRWSADGRHIYYIGRGGGLEVLFRIDVMSGVVDRLSREEENIRSAEPARDGQHVFYSSDLGGRWDVWSLNLPDGERSRITPNGGHRPSDPYGDGYVYYTKLDVFGLWRIRADGSGSEELVSDEIDYYNHENWLLTERGLFLAMAEGSDSLAFYRIDPNDAWQREKLIATDVDADLTMYDVSADGERFLMVRVQSPRRDIMAVSGW